MTLVLALLAAIVVASGLVLLRAVALWLVSRWRDRRCISRRLREIEHMGPSYIETDPCEPDPSVWLS